MNRLKELRKQHGFKSQKDLANVLFVNQTAVSQWERGVTVPSSQMLARLSDMFGVSIDYLLGRTGQADPSASPEEKHHSPDPETMKLLELLETRDDIRYLAAASERATPEHVKATAKMFDELYGRSNDK